MLLKVVVPTLISLILSVLAASYFLANLRFDGSAARLVFGLFALLSMSRLT